MRGNASHSSPESNRVTAYRFPLTYNSPPPARNSADFCSISAAYSRTSWVIFIEQNFGPHIEQKWATLAPSAGSVSS